jgi:hypothetical protein
MMRKEREGREERVSKGLAGLGGGCKGREEHTDTHIYTHTHFFPA